MPTRRALAAVLILTLFGGAAVRAADDQPMSRGPYTFGPDSMIHSGVPQGAVDKWRWDDSKIFPNTKRCLLYTSRCV